MKEPTSFFEHFVVVGLRPHSDVQVIEAAFAKKKLWQRDGEKAGFDSVNHNAPTLEPEVVAAVTCCMHTFSCLPAIGGLKFQMKKNHPFVKLPSVCTSVLTQV